MLQPLGLANTINSLLANPTSKKPNRSSPLLSPQSLPEIDPRDIKLKKNIKALHDWYDRCAIRQKQQVKKSLRDRLLYDNKTINWLKKRAPRRARVQLRERDNREKARLWFESLDFDGSGEISVAELKKPLIAMGFAKSVQEVQDLVDSVDDDGSGEIGFEEFLAVLNGGGKSGKSGENQNNTKSMGSSKISSSSVGPDTFSISSVGTMGSSLSTSSIRSNDGGNKGSAIKKLHRQLENGELGDTAHMELETLLVSYQRSVLTDALFSRGYKAKNMHVREKAEHQRTVDALYNSYIYDQEVKKAEERRQEKSRAKRLRNLKKLGISPEAAEAAATASQLAEEKVAHGENEYCLHNQKTHERITKGARLKPTTNISNIERRLKYASSHVHKIGDLRDHYRDKLMIKRLKEDTRNNSLHAPFTRSSQGLDTTVPTITREDRIKKMKLAKKQKELEGVQAIPLGRNTELVNIHFVFDFVFVFLLFNFLTFSINNCF